MKNLIIFSLVILSINVQADCTNPMTQAQMNSCAYEQYDQVKSELDQLYQQLQRDYFSSNLSIGLEASQNSWEAYAKTQCSFENIDSLGGSIHSLLITSCLTRKTKERIVELRKL